MKKQVIYRGRLLNLALRRVRLPNGFAIDLEVIEHPGAALVVPFLDKNRVILIRQLRPVIKTYIYEAPAGTLKRGEDTLACARREIIEETGFSAQRFKMLGYIYPVPGYSTEKIVIYKAGCLKRRAGSQREKDEVIRNCTFTRSQVRRLFKKNKITDAKTICALSMCCWL